ncbi:calcyclin binding protein [Aphelenchoides avenae]|nr:calcyclin binding protein [Aphelenchus avenae]
MASELEKDIAELQQLRKGALRGNVQTALDERIKQWTLQLDKLKAAEAAKEKEKQAAAVKPSSSSSSLIRPVKKLVTYAFDQSDKFVKLYYTIDGIQDIPAERVISKISEDSFQVTCLDVKGVDYEISAKGFAHAIDASKSVVKQKTDSVLVMLKKLSEGQEWKSLLKLDKGKDMKVPDFDDKADPQESMMKMMKQMYDDGDDEMKRTIRKAWYEGQNKQGGGGGGGFPGMGGMGGMGGMPDMDF